MMLYPCQPKR